jgi:hypothetical protein
LRYLLAILLPPVGMLLCGKVIQAILCFVLMITVIGWPIASIWAVLVVNDHLAEKRNQRLINAMNGK